MTARAPVGPRTRPTTGLTKQDPGWARITHEDDNCPAGSYCGAPIEYGMEWDYENELNTPYFNYGLTRFDDIWQSIYTIFQSLTGEGWSDIMYSMSYSGDRTLIQCFFIFLIIFGFFFVFELLLLKAKFYTVIYELYCSLPAPVP